MTGEAVRYVQVVAGKPYFRKRGCPSRPLTSPLPAAGEEDGSPLEDEVNAVLAELEPARPLPGTLKAALRVYELESPEFLRLRASTKREYGYIIKELTADFGGQPVAAFTGPRILGLRNLWARRGHKAANDRLLILKHALKPSVIAGTFGGDPFAHIDNVLPPSDRREAHPIWPEAVVETVIASAIERRRFGLARAVALARYAGPRREDLVTIRASARQNGRLIFRTTKKGVQVNQAEDPALTRWLDEIPSGQPLSKWQRHAQRRAGVVRLPAPTLVYNTRGKPYTDDGLGQALAGLIGDLFAAAQIDSPDYDLHGLRHTLGVELAIEGASDAEIAAILGHSSPNSSQTYRRQADRLRLADNASARIRALRERARNADVKTACKSCENGSASPLRLVSKTPKPTKT
jgi:integrase